jgi:hypothetical protein
MFSMYRAVIPVFIRGFDNLSAILAKGLDFAIAQGLSPADLVDARLAPDMLNLAGQVQRASDTAKGCAARLAGIAVPSFEDTESNFDELHARISRTVDFLRGATPQQIDGSEVRPIVLQRGSEENRFIGVDYVFHFCLPSFYFHVSTAYAILRHKGVALGKMDYLGAL